MLNWIRGTRKRAQRLTLEAAANAREAVWERTASQLASLNGAEARGYARARARVVVARAVERAVSHAKLAVSDRLKGEMVQSALENVVNWVLSRQQTPVAVPVRRAA